MCANLFDIVNTGQHPDASVVEDGEFFCQFLLAGLDHSPRHHLPVRLNFQFSPEKYHKSPQPLARKQRKKEALFLALLDFAHVQIFGDSSSHRDEELSWFSQRGWLLLRSGAFVNNSSRPWHDVHINILILRLQFFH